MLLGEHVAFAPIDRRLEFEFSLCAEGAELEIGVHHFDGLVIGHQIRRANYALTLLLNAKNFWSVGVHAKTHFLEIQDHVRDVFEYALHGRELVKDAVETNTRNGRALQRRQQDPAQCVAEGHAKTTLQRLTTETRIDIGTAFFVDFKSARADQFAPIPSDQLLLHKLLPP